MNRRLFVTFLCLSGLMLSSISAQKTIRVMSWNLRFDNPADSLNAWPNRKGQVKDLMLLYQADFIGIQEGLKHQLEYLKDSSEVFDYIGVGRDDGKEKGEYSAILYRKNDFEVVMQGTFWLSETPETVSKGWDAALPRICTWGVFRDMRSGSEFMVFNTHFDHIGEIARQNSAKLIVRKIMELNSKKLPVILTGDFNSTPISLGYQVMSGFLKDARFISETIAVGPMATFNGFRFDKEPTERIDYIFISQDIAVKRYAVLTCSQDQRYPSDHFPVFTELSIR